MMGTRNRSGFHHAVETRNRRLPIHRSPLDPWIDVRTIPHQHHQENTGRVQRSWIYCCTLGLDEARCNRVRQGLAKGLALGRKKNSSCRRVQCLRKKRKRRLIEVADDEDDSDVEITPPPTQAITLCKQSTCGIGQALKSKKPMIQSTLDGGIGSSSTATKRKTKTKSIHFTIRGGRKSSRLTQSNGKKKKKIQEEQLDSEGEFEENELEKEMENEKEAGSPMMHKEGYGQGRPWA
ncbi:hypothetical protein YC2023_012456 [Brassica napus]